MDDTTSSSSDSAPTIDERRLVISQLVLHNFKSYAGERVIGPFHKSFTAIVGPNGSGKSNVIDSMLFVFGFKSRKIRQNKLAELIHSSEHHQNLEFCSVAVHFQMIRDSASDAQAFDVAGWEDTPVARSPFYRGAAATSDLVVARRATKDGQSHYTINGRAATKKDVVGLLSELGIDLVNNRFLILQGEVEHISLMKPLADGPHSQGFLEYIEEIIGSNRYKEDIDAAFKAMELCNEEKVAKLTQVNAAAKELETLREPKEEAVDFLLKKAQLLDMQAELVQVEQAGMQRDRAAVEQRAADAAAELARQLDAAKEDTERLAALEAQLAGAEAAYDGLLQEFMAARSEAGELDKQATKLKKSLQLKQRQKKSLDEKSKACSQQIATAAQESVRHTQKLLKAQETIDRCSGELTEVEALIQVINKRAQKDTAPLLAQINELETSMEPWRRQLQECESTADIHRYEIAHLERKANEAHDRLVDVETKLSDGKAQLHQLQSQAMPEARAQLEQLQRDRAKQLDKIAKLEAQAAECHRRLDKLRQRRSATAEQLAELAADLQLDAASSSSSSSSSSAAAATTTTTKQSRELQALLQLKNDPKLKAQFAGVYGRLGDLGCIDRVFDAAVTSVAGASLNDVVVENTATAENCVSYLREHQIGCCTFAILDKMTQRFGEARAAASGPRSNQVSEAGLVLRHQIDCEPKFVPAFWSALRDTLVAPTPDAADALAYRGASKRKVVTLDGVVFDPSGTITGGGQVRRGGMAFSNAGGGKQRKADDAAAAAAAAEQLRQYEQLAARLRELDADVHKYDERSDAVGQQLFELRQRAHPMEAEQRRLEAELQRMQIDVDALTSEQDELLQQLPALRSATSELDAAELAQLQRTRAALADCEAELQRARAGAAQLQQQIDALHERVADAGGLELTQARAKEQSLTFQLERANAAFSQARVNVNSADKAKAGAEQELAAAQQQLTELVAAVEHDAAAHEDVAARLAERRRQVDQLSFRKEEAETALDELRNGVAELREGAASWRSRELELRNGVAELQQRQAKLAQRLAELQRRLDGLAGEKRDLRLDETIGDQLYTAADDDTASTTPPAVRPSFELRQLSVDELHLRLQQGFNPERHRDEIEALRRSVARMAPNMGAIAEFRAKSATLHERSGQLQAAASLLETQKRRYDELRKKREDEFLAGFTVIRAHLKELYRLLTVEGDAELEFVDGLDPFSGIQFSVFPPKKSWKQISNLSGGEKTLSSLALIFALHHYRPTPLYVMDEIDAALDFRNVLIVANYITKRTKNAQFIVISLRNNMFEEADRLVGIYKTHNCTKSVTIDPHRFKIPKALPAAASSSSSSSSSSSTTTADQSSALIDTESSSVYDESSSQLIDA